MLDQSFSADNFRKILDYENRKGVYLEGEYFKDIEKITEEIKKCNKEIRDKKNTVSAEDFEIFRIETNEKIEKLREKKDKKLNIELQKISDIVLNNKFRVKLTRDDEITGKPVYKVENKPEHYFALKQIQYNLGKLYKVKQSSRFAIVSQIKGLLGDDFPKYVIRTDIQEFYESIPHDLLLQKLNEENLLTFYSKKIIFQILKEYKRLSGSNKGLPRGVGVSAYLAELYMRDIDKQIKSLPTVSYYARYVDDIIIIFTPISTKDSQNYLVEIDEIIETKNSLARNKQKTKTFNLVQNKTQCKLEYLGYQIHFGQGSINLKLTASKIDRYKRRIDLAIESYLNLAKVNEKKARKNLVKRIKFLTGNTRLLNNKKNILVGVFYSNNLLTDNSDFRYLDSYLTDKIQSLISVVHLQTRLAKYKFEEGFSSKRFSAFTTNELSVILEIWKKNKE
jgi:hypothetical protein